MARLARHGVQHARNLVTAQWQLADAWVQLHRAIGTRYDKTKSSFLALLQVACICLWLN